MKGLTQRQKEVLEYIGEFQHNRGFPPAVRDIAKHFQLVSAAGVHKHIKALVRKGFLAKDDFLSRSLRVLRGAAPADTPGNSPYELPLLGYVAAGRPIEAITQNQEFISVPRDFVSPGRKNYVLRVRGDSMIGDFICDGDYVVMESRDTARDGETVVALIRGQEATLKRFYHENGTVRLQPANPSVDPIVVPGEDVQIQGVVVAIWRRFG
jgi:repressor LexA